MVKIQLRFEEFPDDGIYTQIEGKDFVIEEMVKQMQILMGYGANSACAPIAIFENKEEALATIVPILGEPIKGRGFLEWRVVYEEHDHYEKDPVLREKNRNMVMNAEEAWGRKMRNLFKSYYDGCGGCNVVLEPITVGKLKNFEWDLD